MGASDHRAPAFGGAACAIPGPPRPRSDGRCARQECTPQRQARQASSHPRRLGAHGSAAAIYLRHQCRVRDGRRQEQIWAHVVSGRGTHTAPTAHASRLRRGGYYREAGDGSKRVGAGSALGAWCLLDAVVDRAAADVRFSRGASYARACAGRACVFRRNGAEHMDRHSAVCVYLMFPDKWPLPQPCSPPFYRCTLSGPYTSTILCHDHSLHAR